MILLLVINYLPNIWRKGGDTDGKKYDMSRTVNELTKARNRAINFVYLKNMELFYLNIIEQLQHFVRL